MPRLTVAEIASLLGAQAEGDQTRWIAGAGTLDGASSSDVAFVSGKQAPALVARCKAGCLIVPPGFALSGSWSIIRVAEPRSAFALVLGALYPRKPFADGIHASAVVSEEANIARDCHIGAQVVIGKGTVVESGSIILEGSVVGDHVRIGGNSVLHPNVTVYDHVKIGARVVIHANCVIGADGFGFVLTDGHYQKFPQVGTVDIGDDVEIGAGCCIDRAALGITRIGNGTKLDNLVHVAHNCVLGEDVVVAAQTGFSGSVTVGDYAVIGGQVGVGEKAHIESRAIVGGKAGILTSATVHAGEPVWGIPARPLHKHLKGLAQINKLPELKDRIRQLKQRMDVLERLLVDQEDS